MSAEERTETVVLGFGYPSAGRDDEKMPRCRFDGGYFVPTEVGGRGEVRCEHCDLSAWEVEEAFRPPDGRHDRLFRAGDGGRYAVLAVWPDGNPQQLFRVTTLAMGLRAVEGREKARGSATRVPVYYLEDVNDEERGSLSEDSWREGFDVGPDPLEDFS